MSLARARRMLAVICSVVIAAIFVLLLGGCSNYQSVEEALEDETAPQAMTSATLEDGVLTVGINTNNAPYCWPWPNSDNPTALQGIDIDVAIALADQMGLKVKFINVGTNYGAAAQGQCDIVIGALESQITDAEVLVGNYLDSAPAIFAKNASSIVTSGELATSVIGVQADSVSSRILSTALPEAELSTFDTLNDAFSALEAGTIPYVACDSLMGGYLAMNYGNISFVGALALPDMRGIAISAANTDLQQAVIDALDTITSNGILRAIRESWVGDLPMISTANQIELPQPEEETVEEEEWSDEGGEEWSE